MKIKLRKQNRRNQDSKDSKLYEWDENLSQELEELEELDISKRRELTKRIAYTVIEIMNKNSIYDATQMKVNNLVYDVLKWYGVLFSKKDFEEPKAYKNGPVFMSLIAEFGNGKKAILTIPTIPAIPTIEDKELKMVIENVVKQNGNKTAKELSDISHDEIWRKSNKTKEQIMKWNDIIEYYKNHLVEAVNIEYDEDNKVYIATSDIICGLVLELDDKQQLEKDIQEVGTELISIR